MSDPLQNITPIQPKLKMGQAYIKGKIVARTKIKKSFIHVIVVPNPDDYGYPAAYEVNSLSPLGDVGDIAACIFDIQGRRAQKEYTDAQTGEIKKFPGAYMSCRAIEA